MFNRKKVLKMCKQPKDNLKMSIAIPKEKDGCHTCIGKWRQSKIFNQVFLYIHNKLEKVPNSNIFVTLIVSDLPKVDTLFWIPCIIKSTI